MRLTLTLAPSARLAALLACAHGAAAALLLPLALSPWFKLALVAALAASLAYHLLRDAWLRLPWSVTGVMLERERDTGLRCEIALRGGGRRPCRVLPSSVALPALVVLHLKPEGVPLGRGVTILPGMLSRDELRALRVMLRWGYRKDEG